MRPSPSAKDAIAENALEKPLRSATRRRPGCTATSASRPASIAPTVAPSTSTCAELTRWIKAIMGIGHQHGSTSSPRAAQAGQSAAERARMAHPLMSSPRPASAGMSWPVALLYGSLRIAGILPLPVIHGLGALTGYVLWMMRGRARRIAERNLSLVITQNNGEKQTSPRTRQPDRDRKGRRRDRDDLGPLARTRARIDPRSARPGTVRRGARQRQGIHHRRAALGLLGGSELLGRGPRTPFDHLPAAAAKLDRTVAAQGARQSPRRTGARGRRQRARAVSKTGRRRHRRHPA